MAVFLRSHSSFHPILVSSLSVFVVVVVVPARSPRRARQVFQNQFRERQFRLPEVEEEEEEEYPPRALPEEEEE